jgi:hypothetical protein
MPNQLFMEAQSGHKPWWLYFLRWGARLTVLLSLAISFKDFLFYYARRDLPRGLFPPPPMGYVYIIYFIGLLLGFWHEWLGGIVFILPFFIFLPYLPSPLGIIILFLPSILYILSWYFHRRWARQQFN